MLQGEMQDDPLGVHGLFPFENSTLGGSQADSFSIKDGHLFLTDKKHPLITHDKWLAEDPLCQLDWSKVWGRFHQVARYILPMHKVLWWRILHHNVITAVRLQHFIPGTSPVCRHCGSASETVGHLFWGCADASKLWGLSYDLLASLLTGKFTAAPTLSSIRDPLDLSPAKYLPVVAAIHSLTFWAVWRVHCSFVFDNTIYNFALLKASFHSLLKQHITTSFLVAKQKSLLAHFELVWCCSAAISIDASGFLLIIL